MALARRAGVHARTRWPLAVLVLSVAGGLFFVSGAVTSRGSDIRPAGGDVSTLLLDRTQTLEGRRAQARALRADVDKLSVSTYDGLASGLRQRLDAMRNETGLSAVAGPGLRVTLEDAPRTADRPGIDPNILVVHQQDIQAFVNALWAGGAEAITLQGQRLITTTGIKCVGSTVVLDGVPYAPPYVIEAIGDPEALERALDLSPEVTIYREYVRAYDLGLDVDRDRTLELAAYGGQVNLKFAEIVN